MTEAGHEGDKCELRSWSVRMKVLRNVLKGVALPYRLLGLRGLALDADTHLDRSEAMSERERNEHNGIAECCMEHSGW